MKKLSTWMIAGAILFAFNSASAQKNFWHKLSGRTAPSSQPMTVQPSNYLLYALETDMLKHQLGDAGLKYEQGVKIVLPTPESGSITFNAWETPMIEPELAAKYPEMKTYTAVATENQGVTAKLDFTADGFRGMIYDGDKTYFIEPYSNMDDGYYLVFYTRDVPGAGLDFSCESQEGASGFNLPFDRKANPMGTTNSPKDIENGIYRHKYRLALACTGEYAKNVTLGNASTTTVLSKIISTINRINGIYEREMSVTLELIGRETDIIFLNPDTDPYECNYTLLCLISENQGVLQNTVGLDNFDIGHVLSTAGGGKAELASVCDKYYKATAASTSAGPIDIKTLLHELAHQFGATHTFNSISGECFNNVDTLNCLEPGSGTTIMSYGGTCSPDNIFAGRDDYFHAASLAQMNKFIVTKSSGATCGTTTMGINAIPVIKNVGAVHNIPKNTPFELLAPKFESNQKNTMMSYNWEQVDAGNIGGLESKLSKANSGPIMRSYIPSDSNNIRRFPLDKILDGSYTMVGERLPDAARTVNFKYTTRSLYQGWGSWTIADSSVEIKVASSGPFRATSPSKKGTFKPGQTLDVKWSVANSNKSPVNCLNVNIYLSLDGGQTFPILLAGGAANTGSSQVTIPNVYTKNGYIKVQGVSNIFYDIAPGELTINGTNGIKDNELKNETKVYPNPATDMINLSYSGSVSEEMIVNMYDMTGRLVYTGKMRQKLSIPTTDLARGNYQIQIINGQTAATAAHLVNLR